ncbi:MFS transporter [Streptomonospora sediminis]
MPAARLAAAGISLIAVCYGLARFAYGLFVPVFSAEFGLSAAAAGAIASAGYAAYCAAVVAASAATPLFGPRAVAVSAGAAATAGTALVAAAGHPAVLTTGVLLAGVSSGAVSPPLAAAVARWVAASHADRVQSVVNAGTGLGVMVSGPVALLFADDWRLAWAAFSCASAAAAVWTALVIPAHRREGGSGADRSGAPAASATGTAARSPWLPPGAVRLLCAAVVMGVASSAVWTFGRDVVVAQGAGSFASTVMWIILGAAGLLGVLTGDISARAGLGRAWIGGMFVLAAATGGLVLAAGNAPGIYIAGGLFGAVYIALTGMLLLWGAATYAAAPASGVGAAFLLLAAGQAAGSPLIGLLSDAFGTAASFAAAAAVAVAGAALAPRRRNRPPERSGRPGREQDQPNGGDPGGDPVPDTAPAPGAR